MPNSFAADMAEYIVSQGLATFSESDTNLPLMRIGAEPEVQDRTLITLYDTGGPPSNPAWQRDEPRIQVRVKSNRPFDYPDAYNLQQSVKDLILGMDSVMLNGTWYVGIWMQTDIATLAQDYNNRIILVANYRTVREYDTPNRGCIE